MIKFQLNIIGKTPTTLSTIKEIKEFYANHLANYYQKKHIASIKKGELPKNENDYVKYYDDIFSIPLKGEKIDNEIVNHSEIKFNSDEGFPYLLINIYMNRNKF